MLLSLDFVGNAVERCEFECFEVDASPCFFVNIPNGEDAACLILNDPFQGDFMVCVGGFQKTFHYSFFVIGFREDNYPGMVFWNLSNSHDELRDSHCMFPFCWLVAIHISRGGDFAPRPKLLFSG